MTTRIYEGTDATGYTTWDQVVALTKNAKPTTEGKAADLFWARAPDDKAKRPTAILWHGKVVQAESGAARIAVTGDNGSDTGRWPARIAGRQEPPLRRCLS